MVNLELDKGKYFASVHLIRAIIYLFIINNYKKDIFGLLPKFIFILLTGRLVPLWGPSSNSWGGLAFGLPLGVVWAPTLVKL